ncbi:recombinase family protein [Rhizobium sp. IY2]|uniref:recombinase family protein n=1 Tax=Rhizobium sp. IY2 TaxID=3397853 RepID=UPI0039E1390A
MGIGYARVSLEDHQDLTPQLETLRAAGCEKIFEEERSGANADHPVLAKAIASLKEGDVLVVWKLDRLSRSLRDLLFTLEVINTAGAGFLSLTNAIDTTTSIGRLTMQIVEAFAEFEREMIRERTKHGLENARRAGVVVGRKPKLKPARKAEIVRMIEDGGETSSTAASLFDVSKTTVKRVLQAYRAEQQNKAA